MTELSLKIRIVLILVVTGAIAMFFQSMILLLIGLRASIRDDVAWAQRLLKTAGSTTLSATSSPDEKIYGDAFSCIFIETGGGVVSAGSRCRFQDELISLSQAAKETKKVAVGFASAGWESHFGGGGIAQISVPLFDATGELYGSINAERSLVPVYTRFQNEAAIALVYLFINIIIFTSIGFLRLSRIFFRPLDKLMSIAENYRPDEQSLMTFSDGESPFRKLSISLNALLDHIKRDNLQLRNTVHELEKANNQLKYNNELVIRSEKLASAGRLSAGLAHEIGNPLTIIQGYVELLGRHDLSTEEKRKFSANAQGELDRIKTLIRQLLDFSRPMPDAKGVVPVNALISEVVSFVSVEKSFAECQIMTDLRAEQDCLLIESDALRQVFVNILFNAVDATTGIKGEREICISTSNDVMEGNSLLVIRIEDNGVGIAEENLRQIFDPFYTTKEAGRGTGLGLFVCHTIIERMGGKIEIINRIPEGIEVKISLPIS